MAAGPGIQPRTEGSPRAAGRSARNYPHLVGVTFSGATTAHVLTDSQRGAPPQVDALDGTETLVTVAIGGNDVGHVPMLFAAGLPRFTRSIPVLGARLRALLDPATRDHHAWSSQPWTTRFGWPVPRRPALLHPNAEGMRAVADMVVAAAKT